MNRKPVARTGTGFTLIELLVVIGIIALLMGILFPALRQVRNQGINVKCQSNLRQLYLASMLYANDNRDLFPSAEVTTSASLRRGAGFVDPANPSAGGEDLGLPSVYARWHDLPRGSNVWLCPAESPETIDWGCSYTTNLWANTTVAGAIVGVYDKYKTRDRGALNKRFVVFTCDTTVSPAATNSTTPLPTSTYGFGGDNSLPLGGYKNGSTWKYAYLFPHYVRGSKTATGQYPQYTLLRGSQNAFYQIYSDGVVEAVTVYDLVGRQ